MEAGKHMSVNSDCSIILVGTAFWICGLTRFLRVHFYYFVFGLMLIVSQ
jgi:hypothetical protein